MWTPRGLSVIASMLGTPLCLDKATDDGSRLSFARVCIEMQAASTFPTTVKVGVRDVLFPIFVEYAWKPQRCSRYCIFGHLDSACSSKYVWVPKVPRCR